MFASKTLVEHLLRGAAAIAAFALAALLAPTYPFAALAMLPIAFVALRGCPMCWTIGLIETIRGGLRGRRLPQSSRASASIGQD